MLFKVSWTFCPISLLQDDLLDPLALAGALVPDLTRLHQRVQSKIAKFNSLAKVFK